VVELTNFGLVQARLVAKANPSAFGGGDEMKRASEVTWKTGHRSEISDEGIFFFSHVFSLGSKREKSLRGRTETGAW